MDNRVRTRLPPQKMETQPPPYEWNADGQFQCKWHGNQSEKVARLCIRDELLATRSQHINTIVDALFDRVRSRARAGFGRTQLMLFPSDQNDSEKGTLVTFGDIKPDVIQLESSQDTKEFWSQTEVLNMLRQRMQDVIVEDLGIVIEKEEPQPTLPPPPPAVPKSRWFFGGRKQSEEVKPPPAKPPAPQPVSVAAELDEVHFRRETEYGLVETIRGAAIVLIVDIR